MKNINRILVIISLSVLVMVETTGCFRYTPSRSEMASESDSRVSGAEAFNAYQTEMRSRLQALLQERAPLLEARAQEQYYLGARDVLKIDVFGFADLSGEVTVSEIGTISVPLVGPVYAADKTVAQLQDELTERFARYVKNPKLRVSLNQYNAHRVSVVGSVVKPGFYSLKHKGYLLTELLAEFGGPKEDGASRVYLIPAKSNVAGVMPISTVASSLAPAAQGIGVEINLEELTGTLDKPPVLVPLVSGDTIIVPPAGQFRVDGEVEHPGSFPVSRRTSALSAVSAAGGFTYAANVNEVEVIRDIGLGKKASVTVDLEQVAFHGAPDMELRDGDVVIVPSAPGRFRARQLVEAFRSVLRGGVTGSVKY